MKLSPRFLLLCLIFLAACSGLVVWVWLFHDLPSPADLPERLNEPSVRIIDRHGRLLYEVLAEESGRHLVVPLESIPLELRQATIATEDHRFYANPGVDWRGIVRSAWINVRGGESLAGGSTITQQVARNLLLSAEERGERTLRRKLREGLLAWRMARQIPKDDILALYLNQIYYGGLAYGVEAAAQTFFGKPVAELDLAECALLAGLPQAPAIYNPFTDPAAARARQQVVLSLMERHAFITPETRRLTEREPLVYASTPYPMLAPHFVMLVRSELDGLLTPQEVYRQGGVVVRTTLDLDWQRHAERAVARQIEALRRSEDGLGHNVNSAALVALDPGTGEILSMVGSPDYFDAANAGAINMALSPRQPGSALKPLVYAAALDPSRSQPWTPATLLLDVRTSFVTHEGRAYTPANYDNLEHGPVLLRQALAASLNIPAVIALDHTGLKSLFDLANRLGLSTLQDPQRYDLSVALGGGEVRLLELTGAYAAFANGGYRIDPHAILEISTARGEVLFSAGQRAGRARALDERVAWLISDILSDNDARRLGFGPNSILRLDRPAAVKTGTTSNFHDNWTVGYTPELVVGVWAGNTDYEPMREVTGLTGAAPIWHQFMRTVLSGRPAQIFRQPGGLVRQEVCALSGRLPTSTCPYRRLEWFIAGTQPVETDTLYKEVVVDVATGRLADQATPADRRRVQVVLDLPPPAYPWARSQGLVLYADLLPAGTHPSASGAAASQPSALRLVSPANNATYRLDPGFTAGAQRLRLEAVGEAGLRQVTLWLDGVQVAAFGETGAAQPPFQAWVTLEAGRHQAWAEAVLNTGERLSSERVTFTVKGP